MKGKIDENGWLWIERAGEMKAQECPCAPESSRCGDWCPLFGEPYRYTLEKGTPATAIDICQAVLVFEEFEDERMEE
jgi:hypothetical protein